MPCKVSAGSPLRSDQLINVLGLVKLSELKATLHPVRSLPVADNMTSQRESAACDEEERGEEEQEAAATVRKRNRKSAGGEAAGEGKVRGRRQKDFDPTAVEEEEAGPQESKEKAETGVWTQNQQKLLELALQQFPRGTSERWDRIAKVVPGKTKVGLRLPHSFMVFLFAEKKMLGACKKPSKD